MPVEFVLWDQRFPLHKEAYFYLEQACKRSRLSIMKPEQSIDSAKQGLSLIYIVTDMNNIIGCFTLCMKIIDDDVYLELPLLAGVRLKQWRDYLVKFILEMGDANNCTRFTMIGRKGFGKLFPELDHLCCVYGRNLTKAS